MGTQAMLLASGRMVRHIPPCPCPAGVQSGRIYFVWPAAVRRIWRRPRPVLVSDWAAKHRIMDADGPRPGKWKKSTAAYLNGIMDAFSLPFVREIIICAPPQTGKTEISLNCAAYAADRAPGPMMFCYQVQEIARDMCTKRVRTMFRNSPLLRGMLTGRVDDLTNTAITLKHMKLYFAWATSISQLSNRPIKYLFLDEVDKYEATNKTEAGPVALAMKRLRSFKNVSKALLCSSPSVPDGEISKALAAAQARFEYRVKCPDCGHEHCMVFSPPEGQKGGVTWPEEIEYQRIFAERLATYSCPACGSVWDDYKRDRAVLAGHWAESLSGIHLMPYLRSQRPRSVGFCYNTLIAPLVSLSETASRFIFASQQLKIGRIDAFKDWLNGYMAEPWEEDFSPRATEGILALADERPSGVLPTIDNIATLIGAVDTQDNGFWYEIRAWGYGQNCESWAVRQGFVESFEALDAVMWIPYHDARGAALHVPLVVIDSRGHRSREVFQWAIQNRGRVLPLEGLQKMAEPYRLKNAEFWPGTDKRIAGGMKVLQVHTNFYKDDLHRKLCISAADPGAWHMNAECTLAWAKMMCAEYVDDAGLWQCPKGKDNHAWDVSVYSFCAADYVGTRYMQQAAPEANQSPRVEETYSRGGRGGRWRW